MARRNLVLPFVATAAGIAAFSAMDAAMKGASLATGVYTALFMRSWMAGLLILPVWLMAGPSWPSAEAMKVHWQRSIVVAVMAPLFFWGLVRLPIAEAIALSFIAPLIALYFASLLLGEQIRASAILGSLLGLAGVMVIAAGRFGSGALTRETALGIAAILGSAVFYALNLVLQRRQALLAGPVEIALFQNLGVALLLTLVLPWLFVIPDERGLALIGLSAILALVALLLLAWGYARAQAQVLVPIEYTGFLWAALYGWLFFDEAVSPATLAGAALIVIGCLVAARSHTEQTAL
ncbi:MAG: DMT family transporter [Novosphingobium sp.]|nr:DMT family transporter [Novosphingobium sp.]